MEQGRKVFDGIICIGGEDWWYHNRGHFDFQVMRRFAQKVPVLFVNSIGVHFPSVGGGSIFVRKLVRKLRSLGRGLRKIENSFWVLTPLSVPGALGRRLSAPLLAPQIRLAARRAGIRRPLVWVHCPSGAAIVDALGGVAVVLQRTDRFEAFPDGDSATISADIAVLKKAADLVVYSSQELFEEERGEINRGAMISHGVDFERFFEAGQNTAAEPESLKSIARPRIGFIGGIDAHTFDRELFLQTAERLPEYQFVLVGGRSLPDGWCSLDNVHETGRVPYDEVARYMGAMDVLIMPWNRNEWIKACNPIKLKEYLATGRPIVSTDFPMLADYRDLVYTAETPEAFVAAIKRALSEPWDAQEAQARVRAQSWERKAEEILHHLCELGIHMAPAPAFRPEREGLSALPAQSS